MLVVLFTAKHFINKLYARVSTYAIIIRAERYAIWSPRHLWGEQMVDIRAVSNEPKNCLHTL